MIFLNKVHVLWSGGLDSTIIAAKLAEMGFNVVLHHIKIRNGGKDAREREAITNVLPHLVRRYQVEFHEHKHRLPPSPDRNLKMVLFIKEKVPDATRIAVGTLKDDGWNAEYPATDGDAEALTRNSGAEVITWDTLDYHTHDGIYALGLELLGKKVLKKTWSCQLWFKKPCGKCYSCKRRGVLF